MIALKDNGPIVRFEDGQIMVFERQWLADALTNAAARAGYSKWWLAGHVAESVASYLGRDFPDAAVSVERLRRAVQSVLQVIGYSDVAIHFEPLPPPLRYSLLELAQQAGNGYELAFFQLLRNRIRNILESRTVRAELFGLEPCVKLLRSAKNWRRDCSGLRMEIVGFVRSEMNASNRSTELQLQLS